MSPKNMVSTKNVTPDPVFNSHLVTKAINKVMYDGKKSLAEKIFYKSMAVIEKNTGENALEVFKEALNNVMPILEIKSRRVGGANYQVPVEVDDDRRLTLGLRWLINAARSRGERRMVSRLANEIIDAYNEEGGAVRKKEEIHQMAEANKAFAHYRW
ncbi:30S ribosomal protein S7 [Sporohalobacter salinus]|uniref:30S ribosomal protein S7 n=1 Tax=Sporohalobacter salinus TaxID=1494606 RepID=UPI0019602F35|nr:30S ribosomal protein S7 [Sporohalobacter salinus]MBM7623978.1 small subunit ribosomal protein S7 [Sporohalobacter salinus]